MQASLPLSSLGLVAWKLQITFHNCQINTSSLKPNSNITSSAKPSLISQVVSIPLSSMFPKHSTCFHYIDHHCRLLAFTCLSSLIDVAPKALTMCLPFPYSYGPITNVYQTGMFVNEECFLTFAGRSDQVVSSSFILSKTIGFPNICTH